MAVLASRTASGGAVGDLHKTSDSLLQIKRVISDGVYVWAPVEGDIEIFSGSGVDGDFIGGLNWQDVINTFSAIRVSLDSSIHANSSVFDVSMITPSNFLEIAAYGTRYGGIIIPSNLNFTTVSPIGSGFTVVNSRIAGVR